MKVAITAQADQMDSPIDSRFGRAKCFVVVDTESGEFSVAENSQNLHAAQGAGIQAGRNVVELGVKAVVTGHVGPKAFATLRAGGVQVFTVSGGTVAEAVEQFRAGKLPQASDADVESHWV